MKKFLTVALAIVLVAAVVGPAMATDVKFAGHYRVQGFWAESLDLNDTSANDAFMDHRFRLQTSFVINDMLSVTTRFDAMDGTFWGGLGANATSGGPQINWDRTWMTIKTGDYGTFSIGRMSGGTWGTTFVDTEQNRDRVKWVYTGIENFTLIAIYEANVESDGGTYGAGVAPITYATGNQSDQDRNTYYAAFVYKQPNWAGGVLYGYIHNKTTTNRAHIQHLLMPYFSGNWGPLHMHGELWFNDGEFDNDAPAADIDIQSWAGNLEGTYDFGPAKLMLGVAYMTGEDLDATQVTAFGNFGGDWAYPLIIMAGNDGPWQTNLGNGTGNLASTTAGGALMWYGGVSFSPAESVMLGANFGTSTADETESFGPGVDDDQGSEMDLILDWKIYDNLTYHAVFAWYWAGEYFRDVGGIPAAQFDDASGFFNQLIMSF